MKACWPHTLTVSGLRSRVLEVRSRDVLLGSVLSETKNSKHPCFAHQNIFFSASVLTFKANFSRWFQDPGKIEVVSVLFGSMGTFGGLAVRKKVQI